MRFLIRIITSIFFCLFLVTIFDQSVYAAETGFRFPTTCSTNGSSCENMREQDTKFNSWAFGNYHEIISTFTDFGVPQDAVIDDIQIKLRIRTSASGWVWRVDASKNNGATYFSPHTSCTTYPSGQCIYITTQIFNSIASPTLTWMNNSLGQIVSGSDINSPFFRLKIWNQLLFGTQTDIDTLLFNVRYHIPGPEPFLDLPWDYAGKGLTFSEAALSINSFFDHEYPLLSTSLAEPDAASRSVILYKDNNRSTRESYSSHDGYDYGTPAKVENNDPLRAAAAGVATYVDSCGACGHAIHIDHGNGFQTRYYHLQKDGLITSTPGEKVAVSAGQQIGKVGFSGNVIPRGEDGAHIHFMVIQDKNNDGNFEDNIPDGLLDPFGWQSKDPDPWENYAFSYIGENRTGNKSYYLWTKSLDGGKTLIPQTGGTATAGKYKVTVPSGILNQALTFILQSEPLVKLSNAIRSLGAIMDTTAEDSNGALVTTFSDPITLQIDFSSVDLTPFNLNTLAIYSSTDGATWQKEETLVDTQNKTATAQITHLTHFALMAERVDTIAPTTQAIFSGDEGASHWFRSDVQLVLDAQDNEGGLGVDYTLYRIDGREWEEYVNPLLFSAEGTYAVEFYSVDNDENIEKGKIVEFHIDKTPPEGAFVFDTNTLNFAISGYDGSSSATVTKTDLENNNKRIVIADVANNTLQVNAKMWGGKGVQWLKVESLQYNQENAFPQQDNGLFIGYLLDKNKKLSLLEQIYYMKGQKAIALTYSAKTNKTIALTFSNNKLVSKEEFVGIRLLQLTTEHGTLKYTY